MWRMISCYFFQNSFTTFAYNSITMITNFNLTTESAAHLCCFFFCLQLVFWKPLHILRLARENLHNRWVLLVCGKLSFSVW